ncbi:hypothetical protein SJAG_03611 [Schizosaccharomyces japonicus yFS275]|uniref:Stress-associated endoplasmic reticulum protein n=1 Tax=Schizosaccharomyces japonicus (strain yFS275 / FY16936) TaxID=402676 RepID=B6K4P9_SCHJY|nr:hypothetical protein SJAG_03611 [Schizosaccharomyces japonicus yFS275]EEB08456.1 hypothetical protein SJAG_03611 [Schizosaccharomyces japonicus yFS275]
MAKTTQLPRQRIANQNFHKNVIRKVKTNSKASEKKVENTVAKKIAIFLLIVLCGGAALQLLRIFF